MTRDNPGTIAMSWWARNITAPTSDARGLGARLRRAQNVSAVLSERAVFDLAQELGIRDPHRIYRLVTVLADVKTHAPVSLLSRLGDTQGRSAPRLSEARFRKLLSTSDDGLARALRLVLPLADHSCHVGRLSGDILFFGEETARRWCFDYFNAAAPARLSLQEDLIQ